MTVHAKSAYDPASPDDGLRVLTTRYWPRGVSKEHGGRYMPQLAPSRELLHGFKHGGTSWVEYAGAYVAQMRNPDAVAAIHELATLATDDTVTIMCVCREDDQCHRVLLRGLIRDAAAVLSRSKRTSRPKGSRR